MSEQNRKTIGQYLIESVKDKKFTDRRGVYEITELKRCQSLGSSTLTLVRIRYENGKEEECSLAHVLGCREVSDFIR